MSAFYLFLCIWWACDHSSVLGLSIQRGARGSSWLGRQSRAGTSAAMSTMMSEEMESATITLESVGESGDKLHALNCGGDLAGVVEMFTRAL